MMKVDKLKFLISKLMQITNASIKAITIIKIPILSVCSTLRFRKITTDCASIFVNYFTNAIYRFSEVEER